MKDLTIKNRIADALQEPAVPPELVERTVEGGRMVELGRQSERRLAEGPPAEERDLLIAQSLLGRLMRSSLPPGGVTGEEMCHQLLGSPRFQQVIEKPTDQLLAQLKNGKLLRAFAVQKAKEAPAPSSKERQFTPEIPQRNKGGPGLS